MLLTLFDVSILRFFYSSRVLGPLYWTLRLYERALPCGWLSKLVFLQGDRAADFSPPILLTSLPQIPHRVSNVKLTQSLPEAPSWAERWPAFAGPLSQLNQLLKSTSFLSAVESFDYYCIDVCVSTFYRGELSMLDSHSL